ncbi:MAG TPA: FtsX-like permease family protein [Gemmatimonadales bacterium]|nr:FtsX-like permease family protein [Gemmatimonadales bacterium]
MRALLCAVLLSACLGRPGQAQVLDLALERATAAHLGLTVGDTVRLGTAPDSLVRLGVVRAVYQARPDPAEIARRALRARFHLPDLAELLGAPDRVDRFGLALAPGVSADSAVAELNRSAFGFRAYPSAQIASESSQTFQVVSRFHRAIAMITIVASAVFLLCIMLLKVEERRLDAAVMRFVGVRRRTIFVALLLEAAVLAVAGSVLGIGIAIAAGAVTNAYYQRFFDTQLVFSVITPRIVALGVGLSLVLGLAAGAIAAARLVRTRPMVLWGRA